jgi:hypothetical protein
MATIKEMMAKMLRDTNAEWLEYADDYQADCAFLYFWFDNLDPTSSEGGDFFEAGLKASPDYQEAENTLIVEVSSHPSTAREFWKDKKWQWLKFWDAANYMGRSEHPTKELKEKIDVVREVLEVPLKSKFIAFATPWVDVKDPKALEEFHNKHWKAFKTAWIDEMRKAAPTDEDIFGSIWHLDASPDPVNDIEEDAPDDPDEVHEDLREKLTLGGRNAWVNEVTGEISLSKNSPGDDWFSPISINTGFYDEYGESILVPSVLEGAIDWWTAIGNSESDITRVSKTKIIISGAGEYSKSWLRRCFFVKDQDGDLVISY